MSMMQHEIVAAEQPFWMLKRVGVHAQSGAFKEGQELACKVISCKGGE